MTSPSFLRIARGPRRAVGRSIGWLGTTALAIGGSNQSLFLIGALIAGQGDIPGQGSAAIPLLILGLLLSYAALPGWIELVMMSPQRVGGIAAACPAAFRPYGRILSTLTGTCYWWGWVPTCGLTAILSATAINQWFLHDVSISTLACLLVGAFTFVNLLGIHHVTRLAIPLASCSALLAFVSALAPLVSGSVDWHRATEFHLETPFSGAFGDLTSFMAGLYLVGFAAPAFEAAACHVAETRDPERNVPRAMKASAAMGAVYFVVLPLVWLGALGTKPLAADLGQVLGPTFAPVFGALAKSAAIWFMMFNMFHGTLQPLAGAARTLSQLADDGLAPRFLGIRNERDVPIVATLTTAGVSIAFLLIGDPIWLVAAANFTYLIGISAPSIAVWLLRLNAPHAERPWKAPRYTIGLGVVAAVVWLLSTVLGFQQFGLPTVVFGMAMAYSGAGAYLWRQWEDRRRAGLRRGFRSLHLQLTGAMLLVLALDGAGYILAVSRLPASQIMMRTALEDIFVLVALLTITVGIVLPGIIANSAEEVSMAARKLATGTLRDFSSAMRALGRGDLDAAYANIDIHRVVVRSKDELGEMAQSFNAMQAEVAAAAISLGDAREGLHSARQRLTAANHALKLRIVEQQKLSEALRSAKQTAEIANAAKNQFMARMSHELRTPLNGVLGPADLLLDLNQTGEQHALLMSIRDSGAALRRVVEQILDITQIEANELRIASERVRLAELIEQLCAQFSREAYAKGLTFESTHAVHGATESAIDSQWILCDAGRLRQIVGNLLSNAIRFTDRGSVVLHSELTKTSPVAGVLTVKVSDTGPGIDSASHETIFASFSQLDETRTRDHDGVGVGLFLARELARRLGGTLQLQSTQGNGATFTLCIPVTFAPLDIEPTVPLITHGMVDSIPLRVSIADPSLAKPKSHPGAPEATHTPSILLAEDNPTNQAVALAALRRLGLCAQVAVDGEQAVRLFEASRFDLVLIDCHMPRMDGIAATAAIRTLERARGTPKVPIIAVTADMTESNTVQCRSVGVDEIISKPFTFADFAACVKAHLPPPESPPAHAPVAANALAAHPTEWAGLVEAEAAIDAESLNALDALCDGDSPSLVREIVETYLAHACAQVEELCVSLRTRAREDVCRLAHTLKSSSAYVGALGFSTLMREVEQRARDERLGPEGELLMEERVRAVFRRVHEHLENVLAKGQQHG